MNLAETLESLITVTDHSFTSLEEEETSRVVKPGCSKRIQLRIIENMSSSLHRWQCV